MRTQPGPLLACALFLLNQVAMSAAERQPDQLSAVEAITAQVRSSEVVWSEHGTVIKLAISNHDGTPKGKQGHADAPGVSPETFARITALVDLEAIAIEKQPLDNASYQLLSGLTKLRDVRLQYLGGTLKDSQPGGTVDKDTPLFINRLPLPLTVLELKHGFAIKGGCMDKLKPQPELVKLELDIGYAAPDCVPFILAAKKLRNLQLHRTTIGDADLAALAAGLPELECLELRPLGRTDDGRITHASLRHLSGMPKLRLLRLSLNWTALPFEHGLDALVALTCLRQLDLNPSDVKGLTIQDAAIQALHAARPDLLIRIGKESLGGTPDQPRIDGDAEWNWDNGVNTHG